MSATRQGFYRAVERDERLVAAECRELVGRGFERQTRERRNFGRGLHGEVRVRVEPRAHRRAAERQFVHAGERRVDRANGNIDLRHPA